MKHKKHSAKALVFDPLFRSRQEKSKKGKGSYARRPRHQSQDAGPFLLMTFPVLHAQGLWEGL
ncbi:MAG: alternative ribosome rescue factor ArfA [Moraxellaceae bacterium]